MKRVRKIITIGILMCSMNAMSQEKPKEYDTSLISLNRLCAYTLDDLYKINNEFSEALNSNKPSQVKQDEYERILYRHKLLNKVYTVPLEDKTFTILETIKKINNPNSNTDGVYKVKVKEGNTDSTYNCYILKIDE